MAVDDMYMENLDEFVNDENRVVTYKWLSRNLSVHVNQAKQMLYWFVEEQRNKKENDALNVTYLVAGSIKSESGVRSTRVIIVPEEQLNVTKAKFDTLTSVHVYSVQKAKIKDSNPLYLVDLETLKEHVIDCNKFSAILCKVAQPRSGAELEQLRTMAQPTSVAPNFAAKSNKNGTQKSPGKKTTNIAGMFGNSAASKKTDKTNTTEPAIQQAKDHKKTNEKTSSKPKQGVMAFFGKQPNKPKESTKEPKLVENSKERPQVEDEEDCIEMEPTTESKETTVKETEKKTDPVKKNEQGKKGSRTNIEKKTRVKKKKHPDSDDETAQKKRRRLQVKVFSDSSSDEEMDTLPESPVPSPAPDPPALPRELSPSPQDQDTQESEESKSTEHNSPCKETLKPGERRRKRTRKLVSKTYVDDSGFMVTEKVYESDSTDASEVEEVKKPASKPASKSPAKTKQQEKRKKVSPVSNTGKKQTALTNFFKKK